MATDITLPSDLWDAAANPEGIVANWFFAEGAGVKKGVTVAEIMVEKTSFDIAAPADGRLHIRVAKDGVVKPGAVIGTVGGD
ncbi:biotin/lipoyl-containing protein [Martelella soudanensis]|uniref:biotin/lipoyl-containing protein n=1 Tax=unclassified Martelella TaxID=2629616 RepID=UPI0015DE2522|nr:MULTISPECIES: biotin/lipoyl-containing protein [unclassified Martelella]